MEEKMKFIDLMFTDLRKSLKTYVANEKKYTEDWELYQKDESQGWKFYPPNKNSQNKNHGKTALRRKIIYLRQELLNLERLLDK